MPIWSREPEDDAPITSVLILLDTLSPLNAATFRPTGQLRAAWSATLPETRILLLDQFIGIDNATAEGTA